MAAGRIISVVVSISAVLLLSCSIAVRAQQYVIGASPSLSKQTGDQIFPRLAQLFTDATGEEFVYRYTGNWPSYIKHMRESNFHLAFDEPHLVGWRVENLQHVPLVKLDGSLDFVIITRNADDTIIQLSDLAGRTVCADAPPAMDGLILFAQFENPSRQPVLRRVRDPLSAYTRLLKNGCRGAVLPARLYERLSRGGNQTRILFLSEPFPNWALSAHPELPPAVRDRVRRLLLDPENSALTRGLTEVWEGDRGLRPADETEYRGHTHLLQNFWGLE